MTSENRRICVCFLCMCLDEASRGDAAEAACEPNGYRSRRDRTGSDGTGMNGNGSYTIGCAKAIKPPNMILLEDLRSQAFDLSPRLVVED